MKILRYHELRNMEPSLSLPKSNINNEVEFNLQVWQGETIGIIGSRERSKSLIRQIALQAKTNPDASNELSSGNYQFYYPEDIKLFLIPFQSISDSFLQTVQFINPELTDMEWIMLTDRYLTASGLQPYRDLSPLQVPSLVNRQARLALNFITSDILVLDMVFADLEPSEKAVLHAALLNLINSESRSKTIFIITQDLDDVIFMTDKILVMTTKALGLIGEIIKVWFPRPRDRHSMMVLPAYKAIRKRLQFLLTDAFALDDLLSIGDY